MNPQVTIWLNVECWLILYLQLNFHYTNVYLSYFAENCKDYAKTSIPYAAGNGVSLRRKL